MNLSPLGDSAVLALLGDVLDESILLRVSALAEAITAARAPGILEAVPAFGGVTVLYDPVRFASSGARPYQTVCQLITWCAERIEATEGPRENPEIEIPVCYGGDLGPDMAAVASHCRMVEDEVAAAHSGAAYLVHAVGFVPGFPYLGGLPPSLNVPRRPTPRVKVPAGSVGIGAAQTGVYPLETPGGWNLIGRTPIRLFHPDRPEPCLLRMGAHVRFIPISRKEFEEWK